MSGLSVVLSEGTQGAPKESSNAVWAILAFRGFTHGSGQPAIGTHKIPRDRRLCEPGNPSSPQLPVVLHSHQGAQVEKPKPSKP